MGVPIGNIGAMTGANFAPLQQDIQRQTSFQAMLAELNAQQARQMQAQEFSAKQDWLGQQFAKQQQHEQAKEKMAYQQAAAERDHARAQEEQQMRERAIAAEMAQLAAEHEFKTKQAAQEHEIAKQQFEMDQGRRASEFNAELGAKTNWQQAQIDLEREKLGMVKPEKPQRAVQWEAKLDDKVIEIASMADEIKAEKAAAERDYQLYLEMARSLDPEKARAAQQAIGLLKNQLREYDLQLASLEKAKALALRDKVKGPPPEQAPAPEPDLGYIPVQPAMPGAAPMYDYRRG